MNKLLVYFILVFHVAFCYSQAPDIEWQNTIGGDGSDGLSITQTTDGGYIIGGSSQSGISGDKTESGFGNTDYWVLKLDPTGNILWQNTIGGGSVDDLYNIGLTSDGGYILGGSSRSDISGFKTENSFEGSYDYWVVKLDSLGNVEWQNTIGGSGDDQLNDVKQTFDGGYILGGYSNSPISGDKTESNLLGSIDYWILKVDNLGNIIWQTTIGGDGQDQLRCVNQTMDGGFLIGGNSNSGISGDKSEASFGGSYDFWIVKIDSSGFIEWQNTIGGNSDDWLYSFELTSNKGSVAGGRSDSGISGDKSEVSLGGYDYWIVKIDSTGGIEWQNTIGGNLTDILVSVKQTSDEGFIAGGYSSSGISGDKSEANIGFQDYWIIKLDNIGNILWQTTIGGWSDDQFHAISQTGDEGYILGGWSNSPVSGDKIEDNVGSSDFWIVKLFKEDCTSLTFYRDVDGDGYGNFADTMSACFAPIGYVTDSLDCNDTNNLINPEAEEICNDLDDNCNFIIDEDLSAFTYYTDADADGYGNALLPIITCSDFPPTGYVTDSSDCDDTNDLLHELILYYVDADGDLYGDVLNTDLFCNIAAPPGYVNDSTDCNDSDPLINPEAAETLNGLDDNCNEMIDEGFNAISIISETKFEIFPNPNNGNFEIIIQNLSLNEFSIKIFDLMGDRIYFEKLSNDQQNNPLNHLTINLPQSFIGIANIVIYSENESFSKLISVIR